MSITIYHNPGCSTSRKTLALIRQNGEEPEIIENLKTPPARATLVELIEAMGIKPRQLLRAKEAAYADLDLGRSELNDNALIDAMVAHPILMERLIVVTPMGVRLCRPVETVTEILPRASTRVTL